MVGFVPQLITIISEQFTSQAIPGLNTGIFAGLLVVIMLFEPQGIYGMWVKTRVWFELFPLARKDMFKRHRSYLKTERMK